MQLLCVLDEAHFTQGRFTPYDVTSKLKNFITETETALERKGLDVW